LDVRFLHDGDERFLSGRPRLEKCWEVRAFSQLWNLEIDGAGTCFPEPIAVTVSAIHAIARAGAVVSATTLLDLEFHEPLDDVPQELANDVVLAALFNELSECHTMLGHRGSSGVGKLSANTTFVESHDGRSLSHVGPFLIHHALGHDLNIRTGHPVGQRQCLQTQPSSRARMAALFLISDRFSCTTRRDTIVTLNRASCVADPSLVARRTGNAPYPRCVIAPTFKTSKSEYRSFDREPRSD
jgi:hypothetical protein